LTLKSNLILNFNFLKISHQHASVNGKVPGVNFKFRGFEGRRGGVILNEIRAFAASHSSRDGYMDSVTEIERKPGTKLL
jgi:hypothetical protein